MLTVEMSVVCSMDFWDALCAQKACNTCLCPVGLYSNLGNTLLNLAHIQVHITAGCSGLIDLFASCKKLMPNSTAKNQSMMLLLELWKEATSITKYSVSQTEDQTVMYMLTALQMSWFNGFPLCSLEKRCHLSCVFFFRKGSCLRANDITTAHVDMFNQRSFLLRI